MRDSVRVAAISWLALCGTPVVRAHSGPPFPIVSNRPAGPYVVSIWTDPDTTSDQSAAGQFWVMLDPAQTSIALPGDTRAQVSAAPSDRAGATQSAATAPVNGDVTRQFAAVRLDHEGPFAIRVSITGPLGAATVESAVDATYDQRPGRAMLLLYLMPFLIVGFLWTKLLVSRRRTARNPRVEASRRR